MKLIEATSDYLKFDNGVLIQDEHDQDCCERVYADFEQLKDRVGRDFPNLIIEGVEGSGFRIGGEFVPCYNSQNGYYGSDLALIITRPDGTTYRMDISEFVEDDLY